MVAVAVGKHFFFFTYFCSTMGNAAPLSRNQLRKVLYQWALPYLFCYFCIRYRDTLLGGLILRDELWEGTSFGKSWNDLGTTFSLLLQRVHALADLRGRGAKDAPPRGSKFCHFPQIIAFHIHLWSWCPHLGEILDPPLGWKQNSPCSKFSPRRARYHIIPICLLFTKP